MALTRVKLERFTAFSELDLELSPGINVLLGENGTGKTHVMKVCYAACEVARTGGHFGEKLVGALMPSGGAVGRLVNRQGASAKGCVEVHRGDCKLRASFSSRAKKADSAKITGGERWNDPEMKSVYIPVKETLANAPGFRSLYANREVQFEEVYRDILDRAYLPPLRGPLDERRQRLLRMLEKSIGGKVIVKNEEFFLHNEHGNLEFPLLAEGVRKLALLWILIRNGSLQNGSILFWDEPETNLNPKMFGVAIETLLELQRMGVQTFLATHDYVVLKEIDLRLAPGDKTRFHSLYRDDANGEIVCRSVENYLGLHPNAIWETFDDLYDRELTRSLGDSA